jgi:hypothetical protein
MQKRQKQFLMVAVPLFAVIVAVAWFVSFNLSAFITGAAVVLFCVAYLRPSGRSLKLKPCALCSRKIIYEHEGELCPTCNEPLHAKCFDEHRMKSHVADPTQPFR